MEKRSFENEKKINNNYAICIDFVGMECNPIIIARKAKPNYTYIYRDIIG